MTIAELNAANVATFVAAVGPLFEHSSWIAEAASQRRPFTDRDHLFATLSAVLDRASEADRTALICAHPDLAGRIAREGRLTRESTDEQSAAGLAMLTGDEVAHFDLLNSTYRAKFGFPFVICAREQTKATILEAMKARVQNDRTIEIAAALGEIKKIARLRLLDVVTERE